MEKTLEISFVVLFIYVLVLTIIALIKKKLPPITITIGKYLVIILAVVATIYYLLVKP